MAEILTILNNLVENIPVLIGNIKSYAINNLGFSDVTYSLLTLILSAVGSFYWMKQWVVSSLWLKISTMLNFILLVLVFYLILNPMVI